MQVLKKDGWINLLTGLGRQSKDRSVNTKFQNTKIFSELELTDLYRSEGFAKRIIDLPAREMTRKGFEIEGDTDGDILKEMKRLGAWRGIRSMLKWSQAYGGALMVMIIDDGGKLEDELNESAIKSIEMVKVYDRFRVDRTTYIDREPESMTFGMPILFNVTPGHGGQFKVHWTRTLIIDGEELPPAEVSRNAYWGDSVYQSVYRHLQRLGAIYGITANIMEDFVTGVLSIENLQEMIAAGQESLIQTRLQLLDMSRNVINTMLLDSKETYTKQTSSIAGLAITIDRFAMAVSAVTGIPMTLLMGQSPKGFNATGESDIRLWYDNMHSRQEEVLEGPLRRLARLIMLQSEGPFKGNELEDWAVLFNPLWEMSQKEEAEIRKITSETDQMYIQNGVLTPEEVAISRFGGDQYSMQTTIDPENREPIETEEPE